MTYHSYGQFVLYGWGYDRIDPKNVDKLKQLANVGANAMKIGGNEYAVGGAAKLLGPAAGMPIWFLNVCLIIIIDLFKRMSWIKTGEMHNI